MNLDTEAHETDICAAVTRFLRYYCHGYGKNMHFRPAK